ncbi:MAG TPA: tRNA lysidine(34) synthetase TilS [Usitatibacter sp.]|nr:tRNA lysidine(34) synthetase TilS [Usitatibacter sp.]
MDLDRHIAERLEAAVPAGAAICVALSGGLDSMVLLDALDRLARARGHALTAVHVHHGLSPNAEAWAAFCEAACGERGIACDVERVQVRRDGGEGLEAAAREARHAIYAARAEAIVALAHHLDDQAETLLLQLLRGAGLRGLAAMAELRPIEGSRVALFRPLLAVPRAALREQASARRIAWIEDESNASLEHDRNYLRHEIAPRLDARFPGWRRAALRCAGHAAEAQSLLAVLGRLDGAPALAQAGLALDATLAPSRRANAVRAFLATEGLAMPSEARLAEIARQLYEARADARMRIAHDGATLVRHRGVAHVLRAEAQRGDAAAWRVGWSGEADLDLGPGHGRVRFTAASGAGIAAARCAAGDWHFAARRGGERMRLVAGGPTRTLKNLLHEAAIPEWQRSRLPLLFHAGRVAWVPGVGIAAEIACAPGEAGLVPAWSPAFSALVG